MPDGIDAILEAIRIIMNNSAELQICIERVHARPGNGSASSWKFAEHYGNLIGIIKTLGIEYINPLPRHWMKTLGFTKSKEESATQYKNRLKTRAKELYPSEKVTLKTSDALMILTYQLKLYNKE